MPFRLIAMERDCIHSGIQLNENGSRLKLLAIMVLASTRIHDFYFGNGLTVKSYGSSQVYVQGLSFSFGCQ